MSPEPDISLRLLPEELGSAPDDSGVRGIPEQYRILEKVADGGMGSIYKAENRFTQRAVAIKKLREQYRDNDEPLRRFVAEAKAASALRHPNICEVHDFGVSSERVPYLVMEWIEGISLENAVKKNGPLKPSDAVEIFWQIADGLAHAHEHGIIHRDIKPANIMLSHTASGGTQVYIVDFGLAKMVSQSELNLTQSGMIVGTPLYMSPEQAGSQNIDFRSDVYSLGCLLYYALAGNPPFPGQGYADTIYMHLRDPAPNLTNLKDKTTAGLNNIIQRAMEKDPNDRYPSMKAMQVDFERLRTGKGTSLHIHSTQKAAAKNTFMTVLYFVLGFIATFAILVGMKFLQH